MNAENFAEIIKNPSQLYQISYQELKTLVLQYPYCSNLHYLLLIKSHMDQHRDFERVLERTATGSVDRRHLYHQIRALQPEELLTENFELGEEFLELRDLSVLDQSPEAVPLEERPLFTEQAGTADRERTGFPAPPPLPLEENDDNMLSEGLEFDLSPEPEKEEKDQPDRPVEAALVSPEEPPLFHPDAEILRGISTWLGIADSLQAPRSPFPAAAETVSADLEAWGTTIEALYAVKPETGPPPPAETAGRPAPQPKHSFSSWADRYRPTHLRPLLEAPLPAPKKKKKKDAIIAFAERSLEENENVVSETLAQLLAQQERYDKAIQMYERLILIFPEKSSFFAEKIEQLKKQL